MKPQSNGKNSHTAERLRRIILSLMIAAGFVIPAAGRLLGGENGSITVPPQTVFNPAMLTVPRRSEAENAASAGTAGPANVTAGSLLGTVRIRSRDPETPKRHGRSGLIDPPANRHNEAAEIHRRLTARYLHPQVIRFLRQVSSTRAKRLYREVSDLIDRRHLQPAAYQKRVERAFRSLSAAVSNKEFLQANRIKADSLAKQTFIDSLHRLSAMQRVRSAIDAWSVLQKTMDLARRHLGLQGTAVVLEFIDAATDSLDRYSAFVPSDVSRTPSVSLKDRVVGIGVEIKPHEDGVLIVKPLRGGPAKAAGLLSGDVIVSVNGQSLAGRHMNFAVALITGSAESRLVLGIRRNGRPVSQIVLFRQIVKIDSISEVRLLSVETKVGYVKLDKFMKSSSEEMDRALWQLHRQGMKALVIDLRGNPGGLLRTAISLSDMFVPCGTIVSTRGRNTEDNSVSQATYEQTWNIPLVILVDENSASASEIFAAAVQENGRGLVVGRKSYGKGSVQTHFPLRSVAGNLRLTTARFFSPKGRVMAGSGVTPDVIVSASASDDIDNALAKAAVLAASEQSRRLASAKRGCQNRERMILQP